jgi:hypothetical protein
MSFHLKERGYGKIKIDLSEIGLSDIKRLRVLSNDRLGIINVGTSGSVTRDLASCFHFLIIGKELRDVTTPCACVRLLTDN